MLYKLISPIVGIERSDTGMHITQIASGATLKFADTSRESGIVEIEYQDRRVEVFVQDLRERSEQVSGEGV